MFGKVARRQIVPRGAMSGQTWSANYVTSLPGKVPGGRESLETLTTSWSWHTIISSMIETNLANCECDCRNILQLISWLTAAVVVLGLCSLTMLVITLYLFKKSRANPYNQNIELVPFGNKVPSNQHKINSFTCLELKETTRILFDFTILFYNKLSVTCAVITEFRLINTSVMIL